MRVLKCKYRRFGEFCFDEHFNTLVLFFSTTCYTVWTVRVTFNVRVVLLWTSSNLHFQQVRGAMLTKIQLSATVHLAGCFQFNTFNGRNDLKCVSKLTIFLCLRLTLRLFKETYVFVRGSHSPSRTVISASAEVDGSLATSLPAH